MQWSVIIPVKALPAAKSRLVGASAGPDAHAELVRAIRSDTLAAAGAVASVARIVMVLDQPGEDAGDVTIVQTGTGLNAALQEGAHLAASRWPADGVAALVGDLPALRPTELSAALELAGAQAHAFVPDAAGVGTTLLTAAPGAALAPEFGLDSAARHAARGVALDAGPGLRLDVDTEADLLAALRLGVGPATAAVRPHPTESRTVHLDPA